MNSCCLQGGISIPYEIATTIVMKKLKKRRNEKRKDSIKKIFE